MTTLDSVSPTSAPTRKLSRIFFLEWYYELLKILRLPAYLLPTLMFPAMFYFLFGISFGGGKSYGDISVASYLFVTYGAFGVIGAALFGFGVGIAIERGQGWTLLKQASPMPVMAYFSAKMFVAMLMSAAVLVLLLTLGLVIGDMPWQPMHLLQVCSVLLIGATPFCAFGLLVGLGAGPNSAPAVANLIHLPMAFASGLWIPIQALPSAVQKVALFLPAYHYAQLSLKPIGADLGGSTLGHILYLTVFSAICFSIAVWLWKRDEGKTFG